MTAKCSLIILSALCLASCGGDNSSNLLNLSGKWTSDCYLDVPNIISNEHIIEEFVFSNGTFEHSTRTWTNSTCSGEENSNYIWSGTYIVGNSIITSSGLEAVEVDFDYDENGFKWLQIIRLNGNEFNYGVFNDGIRPVELDFWITLTKQ